VAALAFPWTVGAQPPQDKSLGNALFEIVEKYSHFRDHRTGTGLDRATTRWFRDELTRRGGKVGLAPFSFDRYRANWWVQIGGRRVPSIPVFYEGVGMVKTDAPVVGRVTAENSASTDDLNAAIEEARMAGAEMAVFATFGEFTFLGMPPFGALIAFNREPELGSGLPVLLVSGEHADALEQGPVQAFLSAEIVPDTSENVTAWFGGGPVDDPFVLTTPLSGWFTAAGERGTGIAITLELAAALAERFPVLVIGTSGHELENFGVRRYLEEVGVGSPRAVMHVGASMAAGTPGPTGELELAPLRLATSRLDFTTSGIGPVLESAGFILFNQFLGEGQIWDAALDPDVPLLSMAGSFPLFHTPEDLPELATSPELLETVYGALEEAAILLEAAE
jgi:hypothetical protein